MTVYKDFFTILGICQKYTCLLRFRKHCNLVALMNRRSGCLRMAAVRCEKEIVKTTHKRNLAVLYFVRIQSKQLFRQKLFLNPIIMIKSCLCAPAYMQCRSHMLLRPVHNRAHLLPVIDLLKRDIFHRRPCDNQAIVALACNLFESSIKAIQMIGGCIERYMACHH